MCLRPGVVHSFMTDMGLIVPCSTNASSCYKELQGKRASNQEAEPSSCLCIHQSSHCIGQLSQQARSDVSCPGCMAADRDF